MFKTGSSYVKVQTEKYQGKRFRGELKLKISEAKSRMRTCVVITLLYALIHCVVMFY